MLSYKKSLKILRKTDALLEGHFILSSGLHSDKYIQCAQLLSKTNKARPICKSLAKKIKKNFKKIDLILSPALGAIILGYEIGKMLNIDAIFAERIKNKLKLRRGFAIRKKSRVIIIEDVITTGKSSLECANIVKKFKGIVLGYACIIDRSNNKSVLKKKIVSQVKINIPTYKKNNLPNHLLKYKATKPGSRKLSNEKN